MITPDTVPDKHRTAGFALFAVLSFSLMAATVATPFLTGSRTRALIARNIAAELRNEMAARGLMQIAASRFFELSKAPDFVMPAPIHCQLDETSISISFQAHSGLIDLNFAPYGLLAVGFGALGFDKALSGRLADAVIQFRTADTGQSLGDHTPVRGGYKHAKYESVSELGDFEEISGKSLSEMQDVFTVHNGTGTIYFDLASNSLQTAIKALPKTQAHFVVQGRAVAPAISIRVEVSSAGRQGYQITEIARGTETGAGYTFLSPIKVEPASLLKPSSLGPADCHQFFGDTLLAAIKTVVANR